MINYPRASIMGTDTVRLYRRTWLLTPMSQPKAPRWLPTDQAAACNMRYFMTQLIERGYVRGDDFELVELSRISDQTAAKPFWIFNSKAEMQDFSDELGNPRQILYLVVKDTATDNLIDVVRKYEYKFRTGILHKLWYAEWLDVGLRERWEVFQPILKTFIDEKLKPRHVGYVMPSNLMWSVFQTYMNLHFGTSKAVYFLPRDFFLWLLDNYSSVTVYYDVTSPLLQGVAVTEYREDKAERGEMEKILAQLRVALGKEEGAYTY